VTRYRSGSAFADRTASGAVAGIISPNMTIPLSSLECGFSV